MVARDARLLVMLLVMSNTLKAQHVTSAPPRQTAPSEAKQFGFLVGRFELAVRPAASGLAQRVHGVPKLIGTWKGWRAMDGFGIEDELSVTDASGNPRLLSHAVRYFDATAKRWMVSTIDVYRGAITTSTAEWKDNAMVSMSHGTDADGKAYASRGRYYDITPASFRFRQDRSFDEGRTWKEGVLSIEAKRVAALVPR